MKFVKKVTLLDFWGKTQLVETHHIRSKKIVFSINPPIVQLKFCLSFIVALTF